MAPLEARIQRSAAEVLAFKIQELHDSKGGQQWKRQTGEAEQEFIDRASREVNRDGPGCALLMAGA